MNATKAELYRALLTATDDIVMLRETEDKQCPPDMPKCLGKPCDLCWAEYYIRDAKEEMSE